MSNLDYWGLTRGSNQVVHSYDFFWHPGSTPLWHVNAVLDTFRGITGLPVCFEFDSLPTISKAGYSENALREMVDAVLAADAGVKLANMSYQSDLPSSWSLARYLGEQLARKSAVSAPPPKETVLLFFSKWANYCYREETEWLHDAHFGCWKLLKDTGIPTRVICEDNLSEDLSAYKGLVMAFSPLDLMPKDDQDALSRIGLPTVADLRSAPKMWPIENGGKAPALVGEPGLAVIGFPIGYNYLHDADQEKCRRVMREALEKAGVVR